MSSKSSTPSNTTTTQELPAWAQPYAQQLLDRSASLSNATTPTYSGQTVADLNGTQQGAISGLQNAATNQSGVANTANALAGQLSNGSYYNVGSAPTATASTAANSYADPSNNPYLSSVVNQANQDLTTAYNNTTGASTLAQFRNAGAFGGSAQQQQTTANQKQLADQISQQTSGMYNSAYNTAANVASQNAAQQNAVALANQSSALNTNAQNSSNYYNYLNAQQNAINGASSANSTLSGTYGNQLTGGSAGQQVTQDQLNAQYQQWLNQVNQPYSNLSVLSSGLSGALGSGTGITNSSTSAGSGSTLGTLLGLGTAGLGAYGLYNS